MDVNIPEMLLEMDIPGRGVVCVPTDSSKWPHKDGECGFVPHWAVVPDPDQPRTYINPAELTSLGQSIAAEGVREIVTVFLLTAAERAEHEFGDQTPYYMLVSGERRWRASGPGYADLPAIEVRVRYYRSREDAHVDAVLLNDKREDLPPLDRARQYKKLLEERCGGNKALLCRTLGRSPPDVDDHLSLNNLSENARRAFHPQVKVGQRLKLGTAMALAKLHAGLQDELLPGILSGQAGSTATEQRRWIETRLANRSGNGRTHFDSKASHLREKLAGLPDSVLPRVNFLNGMSDETFDAACAQIGTEDLEEVYDQYEVLIVALERTRDLVGARIGRVPSLPAAVADVPRVKAYEPIPKVSLSGMIRVDYYKYEGTRRTALRDLMVSCPRYVALFDEGLLAWQVERKTRPHDLPDPEVVRESLRSKAEG